MGYLNKEKISEICSLYLAGKSIYKISAETGVPKTTVERWLKKEGIKIRPKKKHVTLEVQNHICSLYKNNFSLLEISCAVGLSYNLTRRVLIDNNIERLSRADAVRLAAKKGKIGSGNRGKTLRFSKQHKSNIGIGRIKWADKNAKGTRITSQGYVEYTRGLHKGRLEHIVIVEEFIGRKLTSNEVVHHKDHNRQNNYFSNLKVMSRKGHSSYHAKININLRNRDHLGRLAS